MWASVYFIRELMPHNHGVLSATGSINVAVVSMFHKVQLRLLEMELRTSNSRILLNMFLRYVSSAHSHIASQN